MKQLQKDGPEQIVYKGNIFEVVHQAMKKGDKRITFEKARRSPGTRLIIVKENKILITREFRYELNEYDYRLPGGKVFDTLDQYVENIDKDIVSSAQEAAIREAQEEAGITPKNIQHFITTTCGATVQWDLIYFVVDDFENKTTQHLEHGEDIAIEWKTFEEVKELCKNNNIKEDRSVGVLFKFFLNYEQKQQTTQTYNQSAQALAQKYNKIGTRVEDIKHIFSLITKNNPKVLEIGCMNGRDAEEILKYTTNYTGIDIAKEFIKMAQAKLPQVNFEIADVETYTFPQKLNAIFAFASLIHTPKEELKKIFAKAFDALEAGGLFRISIKYADQYSEKLVTDNFGTRTYYYYSQSDLKELAHQYHIIKNEVIRFQNQAYFEIILQK